MKVIELMRELVKANPNARVDFYLDYGKKVKYDMLSIYSDAPSNGEQDIHTGSKVLIIDIEPSR